jgi:hypothetical protein
MPRAWGISLRDTAAEHQLNLMKVTGCRGKFMVTFDIVAYEHEWTNFNPRPYLLDALPLQCIQQSFTVVLTPSR